MQRSVLTMSSVRVRMCIFLSAENVVPVLEFLSSPSVNTSLHPPLSRRMHGTVPAVLLKHAGHVRRPRAEPGPCGLVNAQLGPPCHISRSAANISDEPGELLQRLLGLKTAAHGSQCKRGEYHTGTPPQPVNHLPHPLKS